MPQSFTYPQASAIRELFIQTFCSHWPAIYRGLLPVAAGPEELQRVALAVEKQMREDAEAIQAASASPWEPIGPGYHALANLVGDDVLELNRLNHRAARPVGLPEIGRAHV